MFRTANGVPVLELAENASAPRGRFRFAAIIVVEVNESRLREVELARDGLQGFGGGVLAGGDEDESEGVAFEFRLGLLFEDWCG